MRTVPPPPPRTKQEPPDYSRYSAAERKDADPKPPTKKKRKRRRKNPKGERDGSVGDVGRKSSNKEDIEADDATAASDANDSILAMAMRLDEASVISDPSFIVGINPHTASMEPPSKGRPKGLYSQAESDSSSSSSDSSDDESSSGASSSSSSSDDEVDESLLNPNRGKPRYYNGPGDASTVLNHNGGGAHYNGPGDASTVLHQNGGGAQRYIDPQHYNDVYQPPIANGGNGKSQVANSRRRHKGPPPAAHANGGRGKGNRTPAPPPNRDPRGEGYDIEAQQRGAGKSVTHAVDDLNTDRGGWRSRWKMIVAAVLFLLIAIGVSVGVVVMNMGGEEDIPLENKEIDPKSVPALPPSDDGNNDTVGIIPPPQTNEPPPEVTPIQPPPGGALEGPFTTRNHQLTLRGATKPPIGSDFIPKMQNYIQIFFTSANFYLITGGDEALKERMRSDDIIQGIVEVIIVWAVTSIKTVQNGGVQEIIIGYNQETTFRSSNSKITVQDIVGQPFASDPYLDAMINYLRSAFPEDLGMLQAILWEESMSGSAPSPPTTTTIQGRLWYDTNQDGLWTPSEEPVTSEFIDLYSCDDGAWRGTAVPNSTGQYQFSPVTVGSYYLEFSKSSVLFDYTTFFAGTTPEQMENDSDADEAGRTGCLLVDGNHQRMINAGFVPVSPPTMSPVEVPTTSAPTMDLSTSSPTSKPTIPPTTQSPVAPTPAPTAEDESSSPELNNYCAVMTIISETVTEFEFNGCATPCKTQCENGEICVPSTECNSDP